MEAHRVERKLSAIFAADVEGYSRLMGRDEVGTLRTLTAYRAIIDRLIASHRGRIFNTAGDSVLADFASAVDAVECAVEIQEAIAKENADRPAGEQMRFRIGIHVGDIMVQGDNLFGDAVNVAARLEALAEPGGICVSGTVRDHIGTKLPLSFADLGEQQVKNIAQPIKAYRIRGETSPTATPVVGSSLPLPDKPSIAVLPFANMSGDPEQEYFADGMVEEIITALSPHPLAVRHRPEFELHLQGPAVDVKQVGRELGVRYVLEGSVRKAGQRVRITGQLIDAITGTHLWADRFDGSLEDVFELQDKVALSVAGVIEPALQAAEIRRSANRPTNDLTAYDLYLRALRNLLVVEQEHIPEALRLTRAGDRARPALRPRPRLGRICCLALIHVTAGAKTRRRTAAKASISPGRRCKSLATTRGVLANAAFALAYFGEDIGAHDGVGRPCTGAQSKLRPRLVHQCVSSGFLRASPMSRSSMSKTSLRLSPRARMGPALSVMGTAHFFNRQFTRPCRSCSSRSRRSKLLQPYRYLAACYAHMGRLDEAREIVARLRAITPVVYPTLSYLRNTEAPRAFPVGPALGGGRRT